MKTEDFRKTITSGAVKENIQKMFGMTVNLNKYGREQLEDLRNKLRTRIFQQEAQSKIGDLLTNENYQRDKAMMELLNTRIKEMLGEDIKRLRDKMTELSEAKKVDQTGDGKVDFDDIQVARMTAGGVPKKKAIAKATGDKVKESWPKPEDFTNKPKGGSGKKTGTYGSPEHPSSEPPKGEVPTTTTEPGHSEKRAGQAHRLGATGKSQVVKGRAQSAKQANDDVDESLVSEKAVSVAQQQAAGAALAAKRKGTGKGLKGASKEMMGMSTAELEKFAGTKHKDLPKKVKENKTVKEAQEIYKQHVRIVNESLAVLLSENEEEKAKAITAAGDIVNDYTSWMQRVGQYQTKSMIELADAIKADFGPTEAETFKAAVGPALQATLDVLMAQREAISNAVAILAGEAVPAGEPMGAEPAADAGAEMPAPEEPMEPTEPDLMNEPADEFTASDAGATGREMRESKFSRRLAESHSIISKLAR
jgi:hypothetical protein